MGPSASREEGGGSLLQGIVPKGFAKVVAFLAGEEVVTKGIDTANIGANRTTETQRVSEDGLKESTRASKAPGCVGEQPMVRAGCGEGTIGVPSMGEQASTVTAGKFGKKESETGVVNDGGDTVLEVRWRGGGGKGLGDALDKVTIGQVRVMEGRAGKKGTVREGGGRRRGSREVGEEVGEGWEKVGDLDGGRCEGGKESVTGERGRSTDPKAASGGR